MKTPKAIPKVSTV